MGLPQEDSPGEDVSRGALPRLRVSLSHYFSLPYFSVDKRRELSDRGPPSSGKQKVQGWVATGKD